MGRVGPILLALFNKERHKILCLYGMSKTVIIDIEGTYADVRGQKRRLQPGQHLETVAWYADELVTGGLAHRLPARNIEPREEQC